MPRYVQVFAPLLVIVTVLWLIYLRKFMLGEIQPVKAHLPELVVENTSEDSVEDVVEDVVEASLEEILDELERDHVEEAKRLHMHDKIGIVFRTKLLQEGRFERLKKVLHDLPSATYDVIISVDCTQGLQHCVNEAQIRSNLTNEDNERLHFSFFDMKEIQQYYPHMEEMLEKHNIDNQGRFIHTYGKKLEWLGHSMAWGSHVEPINYWYQHLPDHEKYKSIWVMEDDLGFSGDWKTFFEVHDSMHVDLIQPSFHPLDTSWHFYFVGSNEYVKTFIDSEFPAVQGLEHLRMYSRKMLNTLHYFAKKRGMHAISESMVPTLALYSKMAVVQIDSKWFCDNYSWDIRFTKEEYLKAEIEQPNRIFHGLKF